MMHAQKLPGRGLTAHYFFTFGVEVQLVGDRKNTGVEQRILHLDVAAPAIKLIQKGSVRVFLRFDGINQIVFDDVEPRSVLISCRDDRRFFVVFQSAEDNLVFRTACSDLATGSLDMNRFQRSVLKKGQLMKRGKAGALFGDRYAILTPRKLFILPSKVSVFPSNTISLEEATPRFDDSKGTIHLDVNGKEFVFQGSDKEESQDWFVEIARAATSKAPILHWDDATAARMQAEAAAAAADEQEDEEAAAFAMTGPSFNGANNINNNINNNTINTGGGGPPSHFTSPDGWQEEEETPDTHLDMTPESNMLHNNMNNIPNSPTGLGNFGRPNPVGFNKPRSKSLMAGPRGLVPSQQQQQQQRGFSSWSGNREPAGFSNPNAGISNPSVTPNNNGGIGRGVPGSFSGSGGSYVDATGNVIRLGSGAARTLGNGSSSSSSGSSSPVGSGYGKGLQRSSSGASSSKSSLGVAGQQQQQQQLRPISAADSSGRVSVLGTIYEVGESEVDQTSQHAASSPRGEDLDDEDTAAAAAAAAASDVVTPQKQQQQQHKPPPPPAPPLRGLPQKSQQQQQQQQHNSWPPPPAAAAAAAAAGRKPTGGRISSSSPAAVAAAAAAAARQRVGSRQQGMAAEDFFADSDEEQNFLKHSGEVHSDPGDDLEELDNEDPDELYDDNDDMNRELSRRSRKQQQPKPHSHKRASVKLDSSKSSPAAAAAAGSAVSSARKRGAAPSHGNSHGSYDAVDSQHVINTTGGFLSPGSHVDLEALTDAITARLEAAQVARELRNTQLMAQQQQQQGMLGSSSAAAAAGVYQPGSATSELKTVGDYAYHNSIRQQQQQQQQWMPYHGVHNGLTPAAAVAGTTQQHLRSPTSPAAAAAAANSSNFFPMNSTLNNGVRTVNFGSQPGVISTSGSGAANPNHDSTGSWGRKSLAGLYSNTAAAAAAGSSSSGMAPVTPPAAAAGRVSFAPGSSGSLLARTQGPLPGRLSSSGTAASSSSSSSSSGVVLGEYIIPSVFRVIVHCPEGLELARQLSVKPDLTPHQRCLAVMRWAFGVYNQLPGDARTAIPSGPSRHNLSTWIMPDINTLINHIHNAQQQQQHTLWQQQQQAAAQLLQQINQHITKSSNNAALQQSSNTAAAAAAAENATAAAAAALLTALVNAAGGGLGPAGLLFSVNNMLHPGLLGVTNPLLSSSSGVVLLQRLLTAAAAGKDINTVIQEFAEQQQQQQDNSESSSSHKSRAAGSRPKASRNCSKQQAAAADQDDCAANMHECARCRSLTRSKSPRRCIYHHHHQQQQQQQQQQQCDNDEQYHYNKQRKTLSTTDISSSSSSSSDAESGEQMHTRHSRCQHTHTARPKSCPAAAAAAAAAAGDVTRITPNMNITVRLKRHQLIPKHCQPKTSDEEQLGASNTHNSNNKCYYCYEAGNNNVLLTTVSPGQGKFKGHRLRGHCSFTCDNPLFQIDLAAADKAAAVHGSSRRERPWSAGAVLKELSNSSSSSSSKPVRCAAVCHLSPAAAQTICQAASTAAAAAAAAVRSAVLTIDGDELGIGSDGRPHSMQSLVGQVQNGELDAAEFVQTVAAGRAGALLRQ